MDSMFWIFMIVLVSVAPSIIRVIKGEGNGKE